MERSSYLTWKVIFAVIVDLYNELACVFKALYAKEI